MLLRFVKASASGNTTVLILDPVPRDDYMRVSREVMRNCSVGAEQVGFIRKGTTGTRMDMMGGEFCGNASRSFAAWLALANKDDSGLKNLKEVKKQIDIEVSGHNGTLIAHIGNLGTQNKCYVSISMPLPQRIIHGTDDFLGEHSITVFEGISHLVLWDRNSKKGDLQYAKAFLEAHGADASSFGIMYYQRKTGFMRPLVFIDTIGTLVWENSCGSGSCALAAAIADKKKASVLAMAIPQPGGNLTVDVSWKGSIENIVLSGIIEITAIGTIYID